MVVGVCGRKNKKKWSLVATGTKPHRARRAVAATSLKVTLGLGSYAATVIISGFVECDDITS